MAVLNKYIESLQRELELEGENMESKETPGTFDFPINDELSVNLSEDKEGITLDCTLCPCPKLRQEEFFTHALHGNLFYEGTLGATLGVDGRGTQLVLNQKIDYEVDYDQFKDILENFCNTAEQWIAESDSY